MRKIMIALALASLSFGAANAETGAERQKACNAAWAQHKAENGKPAKGEGRAAYNAFRKECTAKRKAEFGTDKPKS